MKPIDYVALFKHKEDSDSLTTSIYCSTVAKTNNKASTESSTSIRNTSDEVSDQITAVNEGRSIDQAYSSFKNA